MTIKLSWYNFDTIMKACKPFVSKDGAIPIYTQIELSCDGKTVTAVALDGSKMLSVSVNCEEGSENGKIIIPVMRPIGKKGIYAEITETEKEIAVQTAEGRQIVPKIEGKFLDPARIFPDEEPKSVCYFNPKMLMDTFSVFTNERVKIEYYGELSGVVISAPGKKAIVLPVMPPKKKQ